MEKVVSRFQYATCILFWWLAANPSTAFPVQRQSPSVLTIRHTFSYFDSKQGLQQPPSRKAVATLDRKDSTDDDAASKTSSNLLEGVRTQASALRTSIRSGWDRFKSLLSRRNKNDDTPTTIVSFRSSRAVGELTSPLSVQSMEAKLPKGPRWAMAHPDVDLSGTWKPIITADFLKQYDEYLEGCGTSYFFRQLCLKFCSMTRETITQKEEGRILELDGQTPAGSWKRSLISSGAESSYNDDYDVEYSEFLDPDKERVQVEAWWEERGSVHKSILRNKRTVEGGEFETLRYLNNNTGCNATTVSDDARSSEQPTLVTESIFRPGDSSTDKKFKPTSIRWEYKRVA
mmetsp:Transcript_2509/g.5463  ORF Transcript_2509/g.5463 Transcript_2509/m.5463 type:complete len:345 (+) Transcript_2509:131-1165(+)